MAKEKKLSSWQTKKIQERSYRRLIRTHLTVSRVVVQETDLGIYADTDMAEIAREVVINQRNHIEAYIRRCPSFLHSLQPLPSDPLAAPIIQEMLAAAADVDVGPMAAVAGALAEYVGQALLKLANEVIVENGGDVFMAVHRPLTIAIYAGPSPLSLKIGLRILPDRGIRAVCTSSGTVGHSLSLGQADAVCVLSSSCALADAAATAIGNQIKQASDIATAIAWGKAIPGLQGILIIIGEKMGVWGQVEVVPL